jgi:DNA-binding response OmpR family regulator
MERPLRLLLPQTTHEESELSETLGRILIVDDEPDVLEMLRLYFAGGRFDVVMATSGAEAVSVARRQRPDAVLLDVQTAAGRMDRVETVRAFRTMDPRISIVMVMRDRDDIMGWEAKTIGAFDYVPKPFDLDVLDGIVMAAVTAGTACARPWRTAIAS